MSSTMQARPTMADRIEWDNGVVARRLTDDGGRVDWYSGPADHDDIAIDRFVATDRSEVFLLRPDGTELGCVTAGLGISHGFVGQPAWHPDGVHLLVVGENERSDRTRYNHQSFGLDCDLWLVDRDGTTAHRLYSPERLGAVLHPHFNHDGTKLVFAERVSTGQTLKIWTELGAPGGENPWAGWQLHVADFSFDDDGTPVLSNHTILFGEGDPSQRGVYESHGFTDDGRIVYSHTAAMETDLYGDEPPMADGRPFETPGRFVDDIYVVDPDGSNSVNLVNSPDTWEEHGHFHPHRDDVFVFLSSRLNLDRPVNQFITLRLELFASQGGQVDRITHYNQGIGPDDPCWVVSDWDWDRTGRRIVHLLAVLSPDPEQHVSETWVIELPDDFFG